MKTMKTAISAILAVLVLTAAALLAVPASAATSRLPAEYRELQYIESTGCEVIDTGVKVKSTLAIEATFQVVQTVVDSYGNGAGIVGAYPSGSVKTTAIQFAYTKAGTTWTTRLGQLMKNTPEELPPLDTNKHSVVLDAILGTITFDGNVIASMDPNEIGIKDDDEKCCNITIGAANYSTTCDEVTKYSAGASKIYSVVIKDNNTVIRDFVPAVRLSDNYVGMFELVEQKFYENVALPDCPFEGDGSVTTAEVTTEAPTEPVTEPKTDAPENKTDEPAKTDGPVITADPALTDAPKTEKKGCKSAVASLAIISVISLGAVAVRKKH